MQFKSVLSTVDVHVCYRPSCLQYAHTAQACSTTNVICYHRSYRYLFLRDSFRIRTTLTCSSVKLNNNTNDRIPSDINDECIF